MIITTKNTQVKLAARPIGLPNETTWRIEHNPLPTELSEGDLLIKNLYISLDPAMRGWINAGRSYIPPVAIGAVMRAGSVGKVMASKNPSFTAGDYVYGTEGVQQYAVSNGKGLFKVQKNLVPLPTYLGTLGMTGFTAYFGLLNIGQPKAGETVLVSGAAGAVGSLVGQIAKIKGCRVVGIAGGAEKCRYIVEELGFDAAIDYKNDDVRKGVKAHCPQGIDVYFDNVGGDILDIALTRINLHARIVICGAISQYNNKTTIKGPSNYLSLLVNRARMEGFVVFDFAKDYGTASLQLGQWLAAGKINHKTHIVKGIENFPTALMRLFDGNKMGKLVLQVNDDD
jgi:NADPH-dependent curcumin reductase CurA